MTQHTIRRILPPADRSEPLPKHILGRVACSVRSKAAEDFYTKPRYQWCGTHDDAEVSIKDHIAALDAEHGHEHCADISDVQPDEGAE